MNPARQTRRRRRLGAFDGFVLAGALVNVAVVLLLLVHWVSR